MIPAGPACSPGKFFTAIITFTGNLNDTRAWAEVPWERLSLPGLSVLDATHRLSLISSNTARETARADYLARHERKSEKQQEPATMLDLIELLEGRVKALRSTRPAPV